MIQLPITRRMNLWKSHLNNCLSPPSNHFLFLFWKERWDKTKWTRRKHRKTSTPSWIDKQTNDSFYHLVLGDSLAKGYGSTQGGFAELASRQIEAQIHKPITVENLGINGLTTDRLAKKVQSEDVKQKIRAANIITINIGGNNLFRLNRDVGVIDGIKMLNKEKLILKRI